MKMQKLFRYCFAFVLSAGVFASCSQDASDGDVSATGGGETVRLSLSAEVSVENEQSRAINYKLGQNANGEIVPLPQFEDNQEVEVHTILKSSRGTTAVKTLKWKYDATKKKLVLGPTDTDISKDANNIPVSGFNNDGGTKWYISGLIGGTLSGTTVSFEGTRSVKGVAGNAGDALGSLNVPYAFGWTEVTINTKSTKDAGTASYRYASVPAEAKLKFKPLGTLIAVKLGSKQRNGAYGFTPEGFSLSSNVWGDRGSFNLSTGTTPNALPEWTESSAAGSMFYSFASDEDKPGTIADSQLAGKTYYVWVMPHKSAATTDARVRVTMRGKSTDTSRSYYGSVRTWFTDYKPSTSTQGKVTSGRVQSLRAMATHTFLLPIEYVTDYNLAGGEGLTHVTTNYTSPQPAGVLGDLRFADSHSNDQSGYYNWYKVKGIHHSTFNPQSRNLQTEVDNKFGADTYFIPELDHWWGVWPSNNSFSWTGSESLNSNEYFQVGFGDDSFRGAFRSDYSRGYSANDATSDAIVYAIRFKGHPSASSQASMSLRWDYNPATSTNKSTSYEYVGDDSWKCAYRYRRVGGANAWAASSSTNANLTSQLVIDVVYLGEESSPTTLADISNPAWWDARAGLITTKTFSVPGYIYAPSSSVSGSLDTRGDWASYWSSSQGSAPGAWNVLVSSSDVLGNDASHQVSGFPVRVFARRN